MKRIGLIAAATACLLLASSPSHSVADDPYVTPAGLTTVSSESLPPGGSTAYPKGDFYQHLTSATGDAPDACPYHWGAGGSPFRTGPGRCDTYRVGRRWRTEYSGLVLFRDSTDLNALAAAAVAGGTPIPIDAGTLTSNFDHGGGAKLLLASKWPQCRGYEMQVGYEGIFEWNAGLFDPDTAPAGPIDPNAPVTQRSLTYRSSLHSLEVNAAGVWREFQPFGGIRYVRLADNLTDLADESAPTPFPPVAGLTITDLSRNAYVNNNLIGFHGGARGDRNLNGGRLWLSWYGSAGAYCNLVKRSSTLSQTDSFITVDDPMTTENEASIVTTSTSSGFKSDAERMAFVGELNLSAAYQINRCTKARIGYQALWLDGVEFGSDFFQGLGGRDRDTLFHGWFAGIERRR